MRGIRFVSLFAAALAAGALAAGAARADERVALIIGNSDYKHVRKLSNAVNDARAIKATLKSLRFMVVYGENLNKRGMEDAVGKFAKEANKADVALVYYSGHGSTFGDVPYLVPVDARYDSLEEVKHELVPIEEMVGELRRAKGVRLAVLDACRDNEAEQQLKTKSATRGGAETARTRRHRRPGWTDRRLFDAVPENRARRQSRRQQPVHDRAPEEPADPGLDIKAMLFKTAQDVEQATGGNQIAEFKSRLPGLHPGSVADAQAPVAAATKPAIGATPTFPEIAPQARARPWRAESARSALPGSRLQQQRAKRAIRDYLDKVGRRVFRAPSRRSLASNSLRSLPRPSVVARRRLPSRQARADRRRATRGAADRRRAGGRDPDRRGAAGGAADRRRAGGARADAGPPRSARRSRSPALSTDSS